MAEDTIVSAVIRGLEFKFRPLTETQMALLGRASLKAIKAARNEDTEGTVYSVATMLDIIESAIMDEGDRDAIVQLMIRGELEVNELMSCMQEAKSKYDEENGTSDMKPRVHRGKAR